MLSAKWDVTVKNLFCYAVIMCVLNDSGLNIMIINAFISPVAVRVLR